MKKLALIIITILLLGHQNRAQNFSLVTSTEDNVWVDNNTFQVLSASDHEMHNPDLVKIDYHREHQLIDGFGASFNELGWKALSYLEEKEQLKIMKDLFDPNDGLRFSLCRMSVGSNDFSEGYYSLNDHFFDYKMQHFGIERDKKSIIPYIKMAMRFNPQLQIWGSPWSPPIWMKQNRHYGGQAVNQNWGQLTDAPMDDFSPNNRIETDPQTLQSYAQYFVKYIDAYKKEGVNVVAIHPQNEVFANQLFPSCLWHAHDLENFMANYLIPNVRRSHPDVEIWLGTINYDSISYVNQLMKNPVIANGIKGFGVQWKGVDMIGVLHSNYPAYRIMQTESECNNGSNDWFTAEHTFGLLYKSFINGANSYMYWNMILDEKGFSNWVWRQNSMISIDKFTQEVVYNPEYYVMKHYSHFISRNAKRIEMKNGIENELAFKNPDNSVVIVFGNNTDQIVLKEYLINNKIVKTEAKPHSFNTLTIN